MAPCGNYRFLPVLIVFTVFAAACSDKNNGPEQQTGDEDQLTDDDIDPLDECPPGTYGSDCSGVCACAAGVACVEGRTGDGSCINRLHEALTYAEKPFGFTYSELTVDADNGRMIGVAVVTADEEARLFSIADGDVKASPLIGQVRRLTTAALAIGLHDEGLWRTDLADMSTLRLSGPERVQAMWLSSDETQVVYVAYPPGSDVLDLFLAARDGGTGASLTHGAVPGRIMFETSEDYGKYITRPRMVADGSRVVFMVDNEDQPELYSVTTSGTGLLKINGSGRAGQSGEESFSFAVAPAGARLIYIADDDTPDVRELYAVDADGANKMKLSGSFSGLGMVHASYRNFTADFAPDGATVIFAADSDGDGAVELFKVPLTGGSRTLLSGPESVIPYYYPQVTPDSSAITYVSDRLRVAPMTGGASLALSGVGDIMSSYEVSPEITADGLWVLYGAREEPSEHYELYAARLDGSDKRKLSGAFTEDGGLNTSGVGDPLFVVTPSGHVVYSATPDGSGDNALFIVDFDGGNHRRMTPAHAHENSTYSRYLTESGGKIYFGGDPTVWTRDDLFAFDLASGEVANVSDSFPSVVTEDIVASSVVRDRGNLLAATTSYSFAPLDKNLLIIDLAAQTSCRLTLPVTTTSRVLLLTEATAGASGTVFFSRADNSDFIAYRSGSDCQPSTVTTPPITATVGDLHISHDQQRLFFVDGAGIGTPDELFAMNVNGTGRVRISGPMTAGGSIVSSNGAFAEAPNGSRIVYLADEDTDGVVELYAVDPDGQNAVKLSPAVSGGAAGAPSRACPYPITPDSQRVVFAARPVAPGPTNVYSVKLDGTELHKLHPDTAASGFIDIGCDSIQITPDGTHVIFSANFGGGNAFYASTLDGATTTTISGQVNANESLGRVVISADSQHVVYGSFAPPTYNARFIAAPIDGSGSVVLSASGGDDDHIVVMPSGRVIFPVVGPAGFELHASNLDGSAAMELYDMPANTQLKGFSDSPLLGLGDGRVVFVTERREADGTYSSAVLAVAGTGGAVTTIVPPMKSRTIERIMATADESSLIVIGDLGRKGVSELFLYPL